MLRDKLFFLLFLVLIFASCDDDEPALPFVYEEISSITSDIPVEHRNKTQLRLAFGKAVANALKNYEVREYLKRKSSENTTEYFNELVFAIHKNDKINNYKTLEDYINEGADNEIRSLFGDSLILKVLKFDPLVSIKIPDIYYDFDWDIMKYSPIVYVKTFIAFGEGWNSYYYGYHHTGYQDRLFRFKKADKFSLIIKYSEDYHLIDKNDLHTEHGIHLFELIPQLNSSCWENIENQIFNSGVDYCLNKNRIYIRKKDIFNKFIDVCEEKNLEYVDVENCQEKCKRDCIAKEKLNNTMKSITLNSDLVHNFFERSSVLDDNLELLFLYNSFSAIGYNVLDKYLITGLKRNDFISKKVNWELDLALVKFEKIGEVSIPFVKFDEIIKGYKTVKLDHLCEKGWKGDSNTLRDIEFYIINRQDILYEFRIGMGKPKDISNEYFSYYAELGNEYMLFCDPPTYHFPFGNIFSIEFVY